MPKKSRSALALAIASGVLLALLLPTLFLLQPSFGTVTLAFEEQDPRDAAMPLKYDEGGMAIAEVPMMLHSLRPSRFRIVQDDCLESLRVNDVDITDGLPACNLPSGDVFDLGPHLRTGTNMLRFSINNTGGPGGLRIAVDKTDPLFLALYVSLALFCITLVSSCFLLWRKRPGFAAVYWMFVGGIVLRFVYMLRTPFGTRAYDWDGHLEYVQHMLDHWRIPPADGAWQFYQPPLYYLLSAIASFPAQMLGKGREFLLQLLQLQSFVLSCITLGLGYWIGQMLFPAKNERVSRLMFCGILTLFPGVVFFASRITNDSLVVPLSFAFFAFLLRWWKTDAMRDWIVACVMLAAAILTKSSAIAWIAILPCVLLLRKGLSWKRAIALGALSASIVIALAGWIFVYRFVIEKQTHLVGNIGSNNGGLRIQTIAPENYYLFRPIEVLRHPFNSSWEDTYGRRYFWEHLFKSSIVGEWNFGDGIHDLTRLILITMMLLGFPGLVVFLDDVWSQPRKNTPLWVTALILPASMLALVIKEPIGGFQDFRYVPVLIVPVLFYVLKGIDELPAKLRPAGRKLCLLFMVLCSLFLLHLLLM